MGNRDKNQICVSYYKSQYHKVHFHATRSCGICLECVPDRDRPRRVLSNGKHPFLAPRAPPPRCTLRATVPPSAHGCPESAPLLKPLRSSPHLCLPIPTAKALGCILNVLDFGNGPSLGPVQLKSSQNPTTTKPTSRNIVFIMSHPHFRSTRSVLLITFTSSLRVPGGGTGKPMSLYP